jgi:hypothetical protein
MPVALMVWNEWEMWRFFLSATKEAGNRLSPLPILRTPFGER